MARILFVTDLEDREKEVKSALKGHEVQISADETNIDDILQVETPEIVMVDCDISSLDLKTLVKSIKHYPVILILYIGEKAIGKEVTAQANLLISNGADKEIIAATVEAGLRTGASLAKLANSNQDLAKSLYQLNVLYNTSSQLAGSLDKDELIKIMTEGIDKSLNFDLACVLIFRSPREPVLIINSINNVSDRLLEALKLRAILNYKSIVEDPPIDIKIGNLKIEKNIKYTIDEYDFSVLRFDSMFSKISFNDDFYGFVEVYRQSPFNTEDATCFQTLVRQVSLPIRSASLYQEIKETNRKLEKLERLKSDFISIVSHELRTPLTAIKNAMDIILSGKAGAINETIERFVSMGKRNTVRLSGIINDLLDISKIEAGKMDFKFSLININPVIEYVKSNLLEMAKEKGLEIKFEPLADDVEIYADSNRLEQVLTNLVSNAIKFTEEGDIAITASVVNARDIQYDHCFEEEIKRLRGNYLQVCVEDRGIGIERKDLNHVFDKFAQIENPLSRKVGGSGLGLPIAKQLMEAHNGAIWCDSEISQGSRFYFVIPIANDKSNFEMIKKQSIIKAKTNGSTIAIVNIKAKSSVIESLLNTDNLINKAYLQDSLLEKYGEDKTSITMLMPEGDKPSAEFLKKRILSVCDDLKNSGMECDIMYTYEIEGDSHEKNPHS